VPGFTGANHRRYDAAQAQQVGPLMDDDGSVGVEGVNIIRRHAWAATVTRRP
jgi:hypothetical protein